MDRVKKFFESRKNYRIYVSLIAIYLFVILVLSIRTSNKLEEEGVYGVAKVLEINQGSYVTRHVKYEFLEKGEVQYGHYSFQIWEEPPIIGAYYLSVYLKEKNYLNYLFMDIKLPDTVNLSSTTEEFIPDDLCIKFWKI